MDSAVPISFDRMCSSATDPASVGRALVDRGPTRGSTAVDDEVGEMDRGGWWRLSTSIVKGAEV